MNMIKVNIENAKEYSVDGIESVDGKLCKTDWIKLDQNNYHAILGNKSFTIEIIEANYRDKIFIIKVNGETYKLSAKDEYDQLLKSLGMDSSFSSKLSEIKAPMPGMVLDIIVKDGVTVNKGDSLLVLEAMKMENVLKSPGEGIVKQIKIKKGDKVEKNQVLILFS
jgi:biotin carboxyl carrier protein